MSPVADAEVDGLALAIRPHYSRFLGLHQGEVLLTGHSHQAWPDVSREAQLRAWDDAAELVDEKWARVFGEIIPKLKSLVARRLGSSRPDDLAFGQNTHELVFRLLSCLPTQPRVLTTPHEFHSLSRQLRRSEEAGARVLRVEISELSDRVVREDLDLVALSMVFFETSEIVGELPRILAAAARRRIPVLVDAYHAFNAIPIDADRFEGEVFVTGGGYKYAASGEGAAFLLIPPEAERFRPLNTGWMADFGGLSRGPNDRVEYGLGGSRFLGATFDPSGLYRAVAVYELFDSLGLDVATLRSHSVRQTGLLIELCDRARLFEKGLELASPPDADRRAAFVSFRSPRAEELVTALRAEGVHTDARRDLLRLGPGPYTTAVELERAIKALAGIL
ncbi:MAG: hypothetical protein HYV07_28830 [Deltaproteobacteria bacterium]|nr:hypothetical protein [Deltaproteobacteria bacterium]